MRHTIKLIAIAISTVFMLSTTLVPATINTVEAGKLKKIYKKTKKKVKSGAKKADKASKTGSRHLDKKLRDCRRRGGRIVGTACVLGSKTKKTGEKMVNPLRNQLR